MVYECWDEKSVNKLVFEQYLNQLGINFMKNLNFLLILFL